MRGYTDSCRDAIRYNPVKKNTIKHIAFVEGFDKVEKFNTNSEMFKPFHMNAGETRDLWVEMDFKRRQ